MAEQRDSEDARSHLYKNNGYDNPVYSYRLETDFADNKAHKVHAHL